MTIYYKMAGFDPGIAPSGRWISWFSMEMPDMVGAQAKSSSVAPSGSALQRVRIVSRTEVDDLPRVLPISPGESVHPSGVLMQDSQVGEIFSSPNALGSLYVNTHNGWERMLASGLRFVKPSFCAYTDSAILDTGSHVFATYWDSVRNTGVLVKHDRATGEVLAHVSSPVGQEFSRMEYNSGVLFLGDWNDDTVYRVNPTSMAMTVHANCFDGFATDEMASSGQYTFFLSDGFLYKVDTAVAGVSVVADLAISGFVRQITTYGSTGDLWVTTSTNIYRVDPASMAITATISSTISGVVRDFKGVDFLGGNGYAITESEALVGTSFGDSYSLFRITSPGDSPGLAFVVSLPGGFGRSTSRLVAHNQGGDKLAFRSSKTDGSTALGLVKIGSVTQDGLTAPGVVELQSFIPPYGKYKTTRPSTHTKGLPYEPEDLLNYSVITCTAGGTFDVQGYLNSFVINLTGTPGAGFTVQVNPVGATLRRRFWIFQNQTGQTATVFDREANAAAGTVAAGATKMVYYANGGLKVA